MAQLRRVLTRFLGFQILLMAGVTALLAQVDPTKVLVGRWEGQIEMSGNSGRVLTINSVKPKGEGEWVARGRYAIAGAESEKTTGGNEMSVFSKDNEIHIEFIVGTSKNPVKLKLVGENKLEGTTNVVAGGRGLDRRIRFEKVATKAEESK